MPRLPKLRSLRRRTTTAGLVAAAVLAAGGSLMGAAPADAATLTPQQVAHQLIPDAGQYAAFSDIISHESNWNPTAENPSGAYGLGQALPATKMAAFGADYRTDPTTQIKWALNYMDSRYGSPEAAWVFWQQHHWY
ncbi:transglycosylase SLT domain-containing protein [Streptomyces sp. WAC06614]|uniref:aggregation-promoting factor C-terminal-like domain-containing protein n=1 Tax=Streptomyces sp. WAC06614 TaxID=2487416 RepID=UPI000F7B979F|nr:transglycosylase SLT domain-containing protein [Streptomyces sp. WAC06614]RSS81174.1 lytic transglycosylase domain-containing protein [Streptomyces sp. WAC06614]